MLVTGQFLRYPYHRTPVPTACPAAIHRLHGIRLLVPHHHRMQKVSQVPAFVSALKGIPSQQPLPARAPSLQLHLPRQGQTPRRQAKLPEIRNLPRFVKSADIIPNRSLETELALFLMTAIRKMWLYIVGS